MAQYSLFNSTLLFQQNYSGLDVNKISIIPREINAFKQFPDGLARVVIRRWPQWISCQETLNSNSFTIKS